MIMDIEEVSHQLSRECSKALNDWLERCVRQFCPEALFAFQNGDSPGASLILSANGFNYTSSPDSIYEFRQGDTVLTRCKLEINLTSKSLTPKRFLETIGTL